MIPNRNVLWASVVAEELARAGVQHVVVAPGSRSTPLVLALHKQTGLRLSTHLDERAAGFFALGIAKATRRPVAVVVTSGTAVANLLPAVVEARHSCVPLVLLTADRPPELIGVGANQAIDQRNIFGVFPRFTADVGLPEPDALRVRHLRSLVGRAIASARGAPAGPVHLNFPFREPLESRVVPGDVPDDWAKGDVEAERGRDEGRPFLEAVAPVRSPDPDVMGLLAEEIAQRPRGIIVVGPRDVDDALAQELTLLARRSGYPVLADPLSGARYGVPGDAPFVPAYDAFLADAVMRDRLKPDVVIRFGAAPTSKSLLTLLASPGVRQIVVDEAGVGTEPASRASLVVAAAAPLVASQLVGALQATPPAGEWTQMWTRVDAAARRTLGAEVARRSFEGAIVSRFVDGLPEGATLFVSNSLPVRDLDRFALGGTKRLRVLGNRGASGIDGIASTALGVGHGLGRRVSLIVGDLAFLHDLNGLVAAHRLGIPIDILLLNNDGGGIFEFLPVAAEEPLFTELFATPHGLDVGALAKAVGLVHRRTDLARATDLKLPSGGRGTILEVITDRKGNVEHRRAIESAVAKAIEAEGRVHAP